MVFSAGSTSHVSLVLEAHRTQLYDIHHFLLTGRNGKDKLLYPSFGLSFESVSIIAAQGLIASRKLFTSIQFLTRIAKHEKCAKGSISMLCVCIDCH